MKIIIDAMGGDNAPEQIVLGAFQAAKEFGVEIVLVGRGEDILDSMKAHGYDTLMALRLPTRRILWICTQIRRRSFASIKAPPWFRA